MAGGTDGNLITYDASGDPAYVTTGTSGQVLTSGGVGVAPTFQAAGGVPSGIISMWSGLVGAIPSGWVICDGTNSTPNLTDKFIKSAATAGGTGGSATTGAHTLSIAQMPSHSHQVYRGEGSTGGWFEGSGLNFSTDNVSSTGGGGSHTHPQSEPIFFALIFIMKT